MTIVWIAGLWPWLIAWRANRAWSLFHALHWSLLAWLSWGYAICVEDGPEATLIALCMTGAAGVAVLGARRPHLLAWNFVVLGLLGVMLLPMVEAWLLGVSSLDGLRRVFLFATLAISVVNYVPTRLGLGALSFGVGCGLLLYESVAGNPEFRGAAQMAVLLAPLLAWLPLELGAASSPLDRTWRAFRDRYGLVWGQRVREQFNASAKHRCWPIVLTWRGFVESEAVGDETRLEIAATLEGLLRRFNKG